MCAVLRKTARDELVDLVCEIHGPSIYMVFYKIKQRIGVYKRIYVVFYRSNIRIDTARKLNIASYCFKWR